MRAEGASSSPPRAKRGLWVAAALALAGLCGGAWWMVGRGSDGDPAPAVPRSGAVDPVAAAAPTPTLDVEVVDRERGTPIAGASVVVACGERAALSLLTDASGHAASDAVPPGDCQISVSAPGYLQGGPITGAPRPVRVSADETARVRLEASATVTVAGKLIGGTGPAEEVELSVLYVEAGGEAESFHVETGVHAAPDGGFELSGLLPGELQVLAEPPEDGMGESEVLILAPGATRRGVVIRIGSTAELEGRVSAADDEQPVPGAVVRVYAQGASAAARSESDAQGRYVLERLGPGPALVSVSARGFVAVNNLPVELLAGDTSELNVRMERAPGFAGQVLGPDGEPVVGASIFVQSATETPEGVGGRRIATTRAEGRFVVERKLVWPVFVQAAHDGLGASPWTRVESPGEDVTLRLGGGSGLVGRVVDARGRPVDGVRLGATSGGRGRRGEAGGQGGADPRDGRFHLAVARPGSWSVVAAAPGYAPTESARVDVAVGRIVDVGTLVLQPGARIVGVVIDADTRAPIAGARVGAQGSDTLGPGGSGGQAVTGADGRFSLDQLPPRRMSIHVSAEGHRMRLLTGVEPRAGDVTDVGTVALAGDGGRPGGMDYGGIGASLRIQDGAITLSGVFGGSAAEAAGLTKGTRILSIDGRDASSMALQDALELLRGEPSTDVSLEVMRPDSATVESVRLVRREVSAH